jgi:hypothetical protein
VSNGKGDTRRPSSVPAAEFAERWRRAFARVVEVYDAHAMPPCPFCPLPPGLNRDHARMWKPCAEHAGL